MRDYEQLAKLMYAEQVARNDLRKNPRGHNCDICGLYHSQLINGLCNVCNERYRPKDDKQS